MSDVQHPQRDWRSLGAATFPPDPTSAARARQTVVRALPDSDEERVEIAMLLTSELVTNTIRHVRYAAVICIRASDTGRLRVEVTDPSRSLPELQVADPTRSSGFGLLLVDRLASDWGFSEDARGKTVWFELDAPNGGSPR